MKKKMLQVIYVVEMAAGHIKSCTFQMALIYISRPERGKKHTECMYMYTFKSKLSLPVQQAKRNFLILKPA